MAFHYVIIAMISELQNDFNDHLKYDAYKMHFHYCFTVYILIKVENTKILIGKNTDGEK